MCAVASRNRLRRLCKRLANRTAGRPRPRRCHNGQNQYQLRRSWPTLPARRGRAGWVVVERKPQRRLLWFNAFHARRSCLRQRSGSAFLLELTLSRNAAEDAGARADAAQRLVPQRVRQSKRRLL
jgi:hypothetical protein